ncbi:MAG: TolC family protein [Bacteroides sp.]
MKKIVLIVALSALSIGTQAQQTWTLRDCIDYAIDHNIEVKKQQIAHEQRKVELNTSQFSRLPNLSADASQRFDFGRSINETNSYVNRNTSNSNFGLNTSIPLFTGMQIPNTIALDKLNLKAAAEDLSKAKEDIGISVTSAFLQVLFNEEICKVAKKQVSLSNEQLHRMEALNNVGKAAISEVYEAKARCAQDELSAVQAESNRQLSLLELSQLLELPSPDGFVLSSPIITPDFLPLTLPEDIFRQAVSVKPAIIAAQYRLEGANKSIRIAQSAFYPQLSFTAGLGSSYYHPSNEIENSFARQMHNHLSKSVGFSLSVPIFNRLATRNRVRNARLQRQSQALELENNKKALYKEIQQAYYNAVAAQSRFTASGIAAEASQSSFDLMSKKYDNGKATAVEYNEVKMNLLKATSEQIQAKYDYLFRVKILDFYQGVSL